MFTDTYKFEEIEDAFYMVVGKHTTMSDGNIELAGANPSAEEADEGTESGSVSGIDVVIYMRLQETGFGSKKDYLTYMKDYLKTWELTHLVVFVIFDYYLSCLLGMKVLFDYYLSCLLGMKVLFELMCNGESIYSLSL